MNRRVGLINYGADRPVSGISRYSQELILALEKRGVPLTVLYAGKPERIRQGQVPLRGATRLPALLTLGQVEIAWNAWRHDLALIHDPTGTVPNFAAHSKRIATIHDVIPYIYPETSTRLDWMIYHFWLPVAVRRLDMIITVSDHSRSDLIHHLKVQPKRVTVVPQGVAEHYYPLDLLKTRSVLERLGIDFPYILYVGAIEARNRRKNFLGLLEAFALLRRWSDRWQLVVAGAVHQTYQPVFEALERLGLEQHVYFAGFVPEDELPALYNGASLFVLPSFYEGFGFPVLEAMACGTPVVTANTSSLPEVAGDAAVLVDPSDPEVIAEAMRRVLSDAELAAELRIRGVTRAQAFSWERTARETIAVYERVLGETTV